MAPPSAPAKRLSPHAFHCAQELQRTSAELEAARCSGSAAALETRAATQREENLRSQITEMRLAHAVRSTQLKLGHPAPVRPLAAPSLTDALRYTPYAPSPPPHTLTSPRIPVHPCTTYTRVHPPCLRHPGYLRAARCREGGGACAAGVARLQLCVPRLQPCVPPTCLPPATLPAHPAVMCASRCVSCGSSSVSSNLAAISRLDSQHAGRSGIPGPPWRPPVSRHSEEGEEAALAGVEVEVMADVEVMVEADGKVVVEV